MAGLRVLVAMEFSGVVRDAFIEQGHDAMSCDFLPSESDKGEHYQGDVLDLLERNRWDLIIAHPDCTCVCNAGNRHYGEGKEYYYDRVSSAYWIGRFWFRARMICKKVCFENPPGVLPKMAGLPTPNYVQPYMFGHLEQKRTGLSLHGLPPLKATDYVYYEMMKLPRCEREAAFYMAPSETRWMDRARTKTGLAEAMATQWGM